MKENIKAYQRYKAGSEELVNLLIEEHLGWSFAIARSVARAWNMDWQLDGLDGGAQEGLLFCARRYDPQMGVPFRAYARRRIHEAATDEARKSKNWKRGVNAAQNYGDDSREISARLFDIFPSLREGVLPVTDSDGEDSIRNAIRQLLSSASLLVTFGERNPDSPESIAEYREMLEALAKLEAVHQQILWEIYWNDKSMRSLATEWNVDELVIIREHKEILGYIFSKLSDNRKAGLKKLRIRPGLRTIAQGLRKSSRNTPFADFQVPTLIICYKIVGIFLAGN